jgi:hypothetical protein
MRRSFGSALMALCAITMCTTACNCQKRGSRVDAGTVATTGTAATPPRPRRVPRVGTVFGRVLLAEGATLPRWSNQEINIDPEFPQSFPECGNPRDSDTLPVKGVGTPTQLVGVMVSATGEGEAFTEALGDWDHADRAVTIDSCRLTPKLIVATEGDTLVLTNSTDLPFLPAAGPTQFYETLVRGQSRRLPLNHGGVTSIQCGFGASCGRTELVVIYHPVHTTTGADGRFEIRNVPADQPIQMHAWHPRFRESMVETRVARNGRVEIEFTLTPLPPRPVAPATPPVPQGGAAGPESDFPPGWPNTTDEPGATVVGPSPAPAPTMRR